jgi:hypothetical protein
MPNHDITPEQFATWHTAYATLLKRMRFTPPLDREREMLYLLESILLRVRLSIGLGEPGATQPHEQAPPPEAPDPDGFREAD